MFAHGIMFHHFFNEKHPRGQGAISGQEFDEALDFLSEEYNVLSAQEWYEKFLHQSLANKDICLTFDDALLCQYEIANEVLLKRKITAFWFVYSSVLEGAVEHLEVFRFFRTTQFANIEEFYDQFFGFLENSQFADRFARELAKFNPANYLTHFPFYTDGDRKFRFTRDQILSPDEYMESMYTFMDKKNFLIKDASKKLWMSKEHVKNLSSQGHIIGMHSHSHPTQIGKMELTKQQMEYEKNFEILSFLLDQKPTVMSHPCNSYSEETLRILKRMGINLGFRANMQSGNFGQLEVPREDHANIMKRLKQ